MADRYRTFVEMAATERRGTDYEILVKDRGTLTVVIAPHGGWIEPGTSEIAEAIACDDLSLYIFEGLRDRPHEHLHIRSERFDEPDGVQLVAGAETAIAIHGRRDGDDARTVSVGGRNTALKALITSSLEQAGFQAAPAGHELAARDPANICNRCSSGAGVQLELPRSLRDQLLHDEDRLEALSSAVRKAIQADPGSRPG